MDIAWDIVIQKLRELRRHYSAKLDEMIAPEGDIYHIEDTMRLVGTLEACYNHALASRAGDGDTHCLVGKHLPYAVILLGEIGESAEPIYEILSILTSGKIELCVDCRTDKEETA